MRCYQYVFIHRLVLTTYLDKCAIQLDQSCDVGCRLQFNFPASSLAYSRQRRCLYKR